MLAGRERLEVLEATGVVEDLLEGVHAGKRREDAGRACGKAQGGGGVGVIRHAGVEDLAHGGGRLGEQAALDGFHDDDGQACLVGDLHARALLEEGALPIGVVHLELDELGLGVLLDEAAQLLGRAMGGESDVLGQAALLDALHELPAVELLEAGRACAAEVVHEVDVEVVDAEGREALLELAFEVVFAFAMGPADAFGGDVEGVARVALDEHLAQGLLAVGVGPCGVEVVASGGDVGVDHLGDAVEVDVVCLASLPAHATKAEGTDFARVECHLITSVTWWCSMGALETGRRC